MLSADTIHSMYEAIAQELFSQNYGMNATNPQLTSVTMTRNEHSGAIRVSAKASFTLWVEKPERKR